MAPILRHVRLPVALLLGLALVAGCGGGGGGGSKSKGPKNPVKGFGVSSGPQGFQIQGLNAPVFLDFTKAVDASTVDTGSVRLLTIDDPTGQTTAPSGLLAAVTFEVAGSRITVRPTLEFDSQNVTYGFVAEALYEISFGDPDVGDGVLSAAAKPMTNPETSFFFRTPQTAVDLNPGFPMVRVFLVDDASDVVIPELIEDLDGDLDIIPEALANFSDVVEVLPPGPGGAVQTVPIVPVRDLVFIFDDALLPSTVFNAVDGSSPSVRVLLNTVALPGFQPVVSFAELSFLHQQPDLTIVRWESLLDAMPPDGFLQVEVTANVQDIAGNSKLTVTGDPSPLISTALRVLDGVDTAVYEIEELFTNNAQEDQFGSSANWASMGGYLTPVLGGGLGRDGDFLIEAGATADEPGATTVPLVVRIDYDAKIVRLPTVRQVRPGVHEPIAWEFRRLVLPLGWTLSPLRDADGDGTSDPTSHLVDSAGHPLDGLSAPLVLRATGDIDISGTLDVTGRGAVDLIPPNGPSDRSYDDYLAQGGRGGEPQGAAGVGGQGGNVVLAVDTDADGQEDTVLVSLVSPAVAAPGVPFAPADPLLRGVTGRSATLTATTLEDLSTDLSVLTDPLLGFGGDPELFAALVAGEIQLQPNVGLGSTDAFNSGTRNQLIDENHPTFVLESVSVSGGSSTLTIRSDKGESMLSASKNIATAFEPIAAAGDAYIVGRFRGEAGGDPSGLERGATVTEPFLVVNEGSLGVSTTGGGGGGGGGVAPGQAGGSSGPFSDPSVNQRGLGGGGIARDDSVGGLGGLGAIRGVGRVFDDTHFDWVTQSEGRPLPELTGAALVGSQLLPAAPNNGWVFLVTAFDGLTFTIARLGSGDVDIGLTTGSGGADGPGLGLGADTPFLLLPLVGVGGGGSGSGVSITGTVNSTPGTLALFTPGAGAGSGGGVVELETARQMIFRPTAVITAAGGDGASIVSPGAQYAGGGAGGGGSVTLRGGKGFVIFAGAQLNAIGGSGGSSEGNGLGGSGGNGWIRLETFDDELTPSSYDSVAQPTLGEENLGRLIGTPRAVGESRFYSSGLANPSFESVSVVYDADTDGDGLVETGLSWSFDANGPDGGPEGFDRPPFRFLLNPTVLGINGSLDVAAASSTYYEPYDLVSGRAGFVYDPTVGRLLYSAGERAELIRDLGGGGDLAFPDFPAADSDIINVASMAYGGPNNELFLLERGAPHIYVLDAATGALNRTIFLPRVIEGGMAYISNGINTLFDRIVIADNRSELLVTFRRADPDLGFPLTMDYRPGMPAEVVPLRRGSDFLPMEITGMAFDLGRFSIWAVDAFNSELIEFSVLPEFFGISLKGVHHRVQLTDGGVPFVPSALAFDGSLLHLLRATDPEVTTRLTIDPADVSLAQDGGVYDLVGKPDALPDIAHSIVSGKTFLRFRLPIDGLFDDPSHPSGPVSFSDVRIDSVNIIARNVKF
jgi:hypothetical protein